MRNFVIIAASLVALGCALWLFRTGWSRSYDQGIDDGKMMAEMVGQLTDKDRALLVEEAMGRHPANGRRQLQPCRFYDPPGLWCAPCRASDFANCTDRR